MQTDLLTWTEEQLEKEIEAKNYPAALLYKGQRDWLIEHGEEEHYNLLHNWRNIK